jgi:hypothetical protein
MQECWNVFITAELSRSSAPRAALQLRGSFSSGGFRVNLVWVPYWAIGKKPHALI